MLNEDSVPNMAGSRGCFKKIRRKKKKIERLIKEQLVVRYSGSVWRLAETEPGPLLTMAAAVAAA